MQESLVISAPLQVGTLQTDINGILAQVTPNWTCWKVASAFAAGNTAYVVFVREPAPPATSNSSPYVIPH